MGPEAWHDFLRILTTVNGGDAILEEKGPLVWLKQVQKNLKLLGECSYSIKYIPTVYIFYNQPLSLLGWVKLYGRPF